MKLMTLFLLLFLQVSAGGYSQNITISFKNVSIDKVFKEIQKQSDYNFFYNEKLIKDAKKITINVKDKSLETVLQICFKDQPFTYTIDDKLIVIKPKGVVTISPEQSNTGKLLVDVTGVVTGVEGKPLQGATIKLKGTRTSTFSDIEGKFTLPSSISTGVLEISFVGYATTEISFSQGAKITVALVVRESKGEEVVVIGYGTAIRKNLTSSVSSVKGEELAMVPVTNLDAALQGKVPGVQVVQSSGAPGDETYIRIRGNGSLFAENRPLYVIDGVPMNNIPAGESPGSADGQRITATNDINPNDIESIEVLKDAAATAIYGSRAANGVILITTKRGKPGKSKFSLSAYTGRAEIIKRLPLLNNNQYVDLVQEALLNNGTAYDSSIVKTGINTNWQDAIFRSAPISDYNLSVSGSSGKSSHYLSFGYFDQTGTIVGAQRYKRINGRANFDFMATDHLKIGFSMNITNSVNDRIDNGVSGLSVIAQALLMNPNFPVFNADGKYFNDPRRRAINPVMIANRLRSNSKVNRYVGNVFGEYSILKTLKFKSSVGMDNQIVQEDRYQNVQINNGNATGSASSFSQILVLNENTLSYVPTLTPKHRLNIVVGQSSQLTSLRRIAAEGNTNATDLIQTISGFTTRTVARDFRTQSGLVSYFGRLNYSYDDRYLFQVAARIDGSSRFGDNKKYGYFPTASGAWRISNEKFMREQHFINDLKIRGSIGISGSQEGLGNDFPSLSTYTPGANYGTTPGIAVSSLSNKDLSWEQTTQTNLGLDVSLFDSRINLTVDAYKKTTNRLIFKLDLPFTSGFTNTFGANVGQLQNEGLDINLTTENIIRKSFTWSTNFNISFNRNKITSLPETIAGNPSSSDFVENISGFFGSSAPGSLFRVGQPVGSFFGHRHKGIDPATGNYIYDDIDNDGKITAADRVVLGNALPNYTGSLTNTFGYKGFALSVFIFGSYGNKVYNQTRAVLERMAGYGNSTTKTLDRWTATKSSPDVPKAVFTDPVQATGSQNGLMSQRWLEDGSFLRLKNITLNYNIPQQLLKRVGITSARVFVSGQNLALITNYSGFDPESQNQQFKNSQLGIDYLTQPQPRTITAGFNVNF